MDGAQRRMRPHATLLLMLGVLVRTTEVYNRSPAMSAESLGTLGVLGIVQNIFIFYRYLSSFKPNQLRDLFKVTNNGSLSVEYQMTDPYLSPHIDQAIPPPTIIFGVISVTTSLHMSHLLRWENISIMKRQRLHIRTPRRWRIRQKRFISKTPLSILNHPSSKVHNKTSPPQARKRVPPAQLSPLAICDPVETR